MGDTVAISPAENNKYPDRLKTRIHIHVYSNYARSGTSIFFMTCQEVVGGE